ncbi:MAG: hypothetical protein M1483_01520 [Actinobacteria bacterium]|nr:hypothetical protein [Actinomycetota bacterium]MCL6104309.1 hypothetical protein [Actinomycetota bacterium]
MTNETVLYQNIEGQQEAVRLLKLSAKSPSHAYLLLGEGGAKKRECAKAFAASLFCEQGGCASCEHCRIALQEQHPDLLVIECSTEPFSVETARSVVQTAALHPRFASKRIIMLCDFHLAGQAATVLLKIVEQPPPNTIFIILAEWIPKELFILASRCVEIPFLPPSSDIENWLEEKGVSNAAIIAGICGGDKQRAKAFIESTELTQWMDFWITLPTRLDKKCSWVAVETKRVTEEYIGKNKERYQRTTQLLEGLTILMYCYSQRLKAETKEADRWLRALTIINRTMQSLKKYNPNEELLIQNLFIELGDLT